LFLLSKKLVPSTTWEVIKFFKVFYILVVIQGLLIYLVFWHIHFPIMPDRVSENCLVTF
jgi:hypothetical protein